MISFVNAKINLGLNVVRRREDGYHDLKTVFCPVGLFSGTPGDHSRLCDILEIVPSSEDSLTLKGLQVDCPLEKNLVWKALRLFREEAVSEGAELPPVAVTLEKHLPFGAGMGAGSADASFCLRMLNELAGSPFSQKKLIDMAARLGADCPFFIINAPAYAEGIGERLTPIYLSLSNKWILILKEELAISTREAFAGIVPAEPEYSPAEIVKEPIESWRGRLTNDFERPAFALHPQLRQQKDYLYDSGAIYASMSGSGSAFFGIYADEQTARRALSAATSPYRQLTRLA